MPVQYSKTSPYYKATIVNDRMEMANLPVIPKYADDVSVVINATYQYRPDLLSFDLYGTVAYWWVFAARNPNVIEDPVFGFKSGKRIFIPKQTTIESVVG